MQIECNFDYSSVVFLQQVAKTNVFDLFESPQKHS